MLVSMLSNLSVLHTTPFVLPPRLRCAPTAASIISGQCHCSCGSHPLHVAEAAIPTMCHIGTLPPELLKEIFQMATLKYTGMHYVGHSLALSHVCSHWRAVALDTPRLWTLLTLFVTASCRDPQPMIKAMLVRSRNLQLDITITELMDRKPLAVLQALHAVFPYSHRIQRFTVSTRCSLAMDALFNWRCELPNLQKLILHFQSDDAWPRISNAAMPADSALAKLRVQQLTVAVGDVRWLVHVPKVAQGLGELDVGTIVPLHQWALHFLLSTCPQLRKVTAIIANTPVPIAPHVADAQCLQMLCICTDADLTLFWLGVRAPALKTLRLHSVRPFAWINTRGMRSNAGILFFLQRSCCQLTELSLCQAFLHSDELDELIPWVPALTQFHLYIADLSKESTIDGSLHILHRLADDSGKTMLHCLRAIDFTFPSWGAYEWAERNGLRAFVKSRAGLVVRAGCFAESTTRKLRVGQRRADYILPPFAVAERAPVITLVPR